MLSIDENFGHFGPRSCLQPSVLWRLLIFLKKTAWIAVIAAVLIKTAPQFGESTTTSQGAEGGPSFVPDGDDTEVVA